MKSLQIALLFFVVLATSCAQNPEYKTPKTQLERFSYSIGVNIATSMKDKHDLKEIDALSIAKGFQDVIYNKKLDISLLATDTILNKYFDDLKQDVLKEQAADELIRGEEYMIENAKKEGVKITDSGLQYEILKLGNRGVQAQKDNIVTIHYQASLKIPLLMNFKSYFAYHLQQIQSIYWHHKLINKKKILGKCPK